MYYRTRVLVFALFLTATSRAVLFQWKFLIPFMYKPSYYSISYPARHIFCNLLLIPSFIGTLNSWSHCSSHGSICHSWKLQAQVENSSISLGSQFLKSFLLTVLFSLWPQPLTLRPFCHEEENLIFKDCNSNSHLLLCWFIPYLPLNSCMWLEEKSTTPLSGFSLNQQLWGSNGSQFPGVLSYLPISSLGKIGS